MRHASEAVSQFVVRRALSSVFYPIAFVRHAKVEAAPIDGAVASQVGLEASTDDVLLRVFFFFFCGNIRICKATALPSWASACLRSGRHKISPTTLFHHISHWVKLCKIVCTLLAEGRSFKAITALADSRACERIIAACSVNSSRMSTTPKLQHHPVIVLPAACYTQNYSGLFRNSEQPDSVDGPLEVSRYCGNIVYFPPVTIRYCKVNYLPILFNWLKCDVCYVMRAINPLL